MSRKEKIPRKMKMSRKKKMLRVLKVSSLMFKKFQLKIVLFMRRKNLPDSLTSSPSGPQGWFRL